MTKAFYAITLAILSVTFLLLWVTGPAQAEDEPSTVRTEARDAFACPGMHAEWLDKKTVQCLKERP